MSNAALCYHSTGVLQLPCGARAYPQLKLCTHHAAPGGAPTVGAAPTATNHRHALACRRRASPHLVAIYAARDVCISSSMMQMLGGMRQPPSIATTLGCLRRPRMRISCWKLQRHAVVQSGYSHGTVMHEGMAVHARQGMLMEQAQCRMSAGCWKLQELLRQEVPPAYV